MKAEPAWLPSYREPPSRRVVRNPEIIASRDRNRLVPNGWRDPI